MADAEEEKKEIKIPAKPEFEFMDKLWEKDGMKEKVKMEENKGEKEVTDVKELRKLMMKQTL